MLIQSTSVCLIRSEDNDSPGRYHRIQQSVLYGKFLGMSIITSKHNRNTRLHSSWSERNSRIWRKYMHANGFKTIYIRTYIYVYIYAHVHMFSSIHGVTNSHEPILSTSKVPILLRYNASGKEPNRTLVRVVALTMKCRSRHHFTSCVHENGFIRFPGLWMDVSGAYYYYYYYLVADMVKSLSSNRRISRKNRCEMLYVPICLSAAEWLPGWWNAQENIHPFQCLRGHTSWISDLSWTKVVNHVILFTSSLSANKPTTMKFDWLIFSVNTYFRYGPVESFSLSLSHPLPMLSRLAISLVCAVASVWWNACHCVNSSLCLCGEITKCLRKILVR